MKIIERVGDANEEKNVLKVTDCSVVEVQQYISAVTSDPSAHTARCSCRWLQLHKENLVGRRADNRKKKKRRKKTRQKTDLLEFGYLYEGRR